MPQDSQLIPEPNMVSLYSPNKKESLLENAVLNQSMLELAINSLAYSNLPMLELLHKYASDQTPLSTSFEFAHLENAESKPAVIITHKTQVVFEAQAGPVLKQFIEKQSVSIKS